MVRLGVRAAGELADAYNAARCDRWGDLLSPVQIRLRLDTAFGLTSLYGSPPGTDEVFEAIGAAIVRCALPEATRGDRMLAWRAVALLNRLVPLAGLEVAACLTTRPLQEQALLDALLEGRARVLRAVQAAPFPSADVPAATQRYGSRPAGSPSRLNLPRQTRP